MVLSDEEFLNLIASPDESYSKIKTLIETWGNSQDFFDMLNEEKILLEKTNLADWRQRGRQCSRNQNKRLFNRLHCGNDFIRCSRIRCGNVEKSGAKRNYKRHDLYANFSLLGAAFLFIVTLYMFAKNSDNIFLEWFLFAA